MPRKEELEEWKKRKAASTAKPVKSVAVTASLRSKVQKAGQSTIFQNNTRSSSTNDRNVVNAGKKKIGANTPIGKLNARLRTINSATANKENGIKENILQSDKETATKTNCKASASSKSNSLIEMKMEQAEKLSMKHGARVARAMLEELPKDPECEHLELLSQAIYWLTCIKIERDAHEWDRAEQLFLRAEPLVRSAVDKRVIAAAYEAFREEADAILETKMNSIATNKSSQASALPVVHSFVPKVENPGPNTKRKFENVADTEEATSFSKALKSNSNSFFSAVDVSSTRMKFENGHRQSKKIDSQSALTTVDDVQNGSGAVDVKSLAQNLMLNLGKCSAQARSLPGAVALPGMPAFSKTKEPVSKTPKVAVMSAEELSEYLGICNDDDDDDDDEKEEEKKAEKIPAHVTVEPDVFVELEKVRSGAALPVKKVCHSRGPVHLTGPSIAMDSDSDSEEEDVEDEKSKKVNMPAQSDNKKEVQIQPAKPSRTHQTSHQEDTTLPPRTTRSGVCFAEQNFRTPGKRKKSLGGSSEKKQLKRKVTPFKPTYEDIIVPTSPDSPLQ